MKQSMQTVRLLICLTLLLAGLAVGGTAAATTIVKVGTLAPANSPWAKGFKKLAADIASDTNGELQLDFQWNASAGDEALMVQKIRTGQLDAAAVTTLGLAQTGVTDVLLFELPGLFTSWAKLDEARAALKDDFDRLFEAKGFTILGWGDLGRLRTMSVGFEIHHPSDLQGKGVFYYTGDVVSPKMYSAIGGITPKQLTINEVLPMLTGGSINVLLAPSMGAEQLQWSSRVTDICTETVTFVIGAVLASSARLASLPPNLRQIIVTRGAESADRLTKTIRNLDAQAWARLKTTKHTYDLTEPERQEWRAVFVKVAKELRGSVFTPAVFDRIVQLSGNPLAN